MEELRPVLRALFTTQQLAVLSTHGQDQSYSSLVAFAATDDLVTLLFATTRATRKFANLLANPRVSLLMDNRANRVADFQEAIAATATGRAQEARGSERDRLLGVYLERHPHLEDFVSVPSCALVQVTVESYYLVRRFQEVAVLRMTT